MRYFAIGDEDTVLGFSLGGVAGRVATTPATADAAFRDALEDRQVGIVIITERVAELIRPLVDSYLFSGRFPLLVEVPDRDGPVAGKPDLRELANQAIGIRL